MADLRPQYNEEAVGANHPSKADVINRAYNVEHDVDGTHGDITTTLNLTSGQIAFPATAVPSADPNTLDDYEEGVYQATITCVTSGSYVMATYNTLGYTKVGRVCFVHGYLGVTSEDAPNGLIKISLPFTALALTPEANYTTGVAWLSDHGGSIPNGIVVVVPQSANYLLLRNVADDGTATFLDQDDVDSIWTIAFSVAYFV